VQGHRPFRLRGRFPLARVPAATSEGIAAAAVTHAGQSPRDLRIAEVAALDMRVKDGEVERYRVKGRLSLKYED
jgi:flavin-binding protein dodecin